MKEMKKDKKSDWELEERKRERKEEDHKTKEGLEQQEGSPEKEEKN